MDETAEQLAELQAVLDRSRERARPYLRSIFTAEKTLSAADLVGLFQGPRQVAVATVSSSGDPRVAPVDALLVRGNFCFGTHETALRIRHLRRNPAISLTYFERDEIAVVAHGLGELIEYGNRDFRELDERFLAVYGGTPSRPDEGSVFVRVVPSLIFTYARDARRFVPWR